LIITGFHLSSIFLFKRSISGIVLMKKFNIEYRINQHRNNKTRLYIQPKRIDSIPTSTAHQTCSIPTDPNCSKSKSLKTSALEVLP
ncbi:hypothetical protein BpHYR1_007573, partial [Brachionus plicatilis]